MRNPPSIQALRSDKRFDALVKQQMVEHQHIISSNHKEMQTLRDSLSLAVERFESLSKRSELELKDFKQHAIDNFCAIKDKLTANDSIIADQRKTIEALYQQLNEFHDAYASKNAVEKVKKDLGLEIKANTISHINSFQEFQRELNTLINSLQNDLVKLTRNTEQKLARLTEKFESNSSISRMDKDGVLKEIRIYEKTIFIIEKKIENIYTLIERIGKRGESCHRPE